MQFIEMKNAKILFANKQFTSLYCDGSFDNIWPFSGWIKRHICRLENLKALKKYFHNNAVNKSKIYLESEESIFPCFSI